MEDVYGNRGSILDDAVGTYDSVKSQIDELKQVDQELAEILKKQSAKIKVVGVGGGGGNSLSRMREIGIKGGELIAINTDAQDLLYSNADQKILIGRELTQGIRNKEENI